MTVVSPCVSNYNDGLWWLNTFRTAFRNSTGREPRMDHMCLHCYTNSAQNMMSSINAMAKDYKRPIWINEFACPPYVSACSTWVMLYGVALHSGALHASRSIGGSRFSFYAVVRSFWIGFIASFQLGTKTTRVTDTAPYCTILHHIMTSSHCTTSQRYQNCTSPHQMAFMKEALPLLEASPDVYRYAWFVQRDNRPP